jgi:hypothetical protein
MEPLRYPPAPPPGINFDVTFTDGTTTRITVWERAFPGESSLYEVPGAPPALSPERAASSWAWHQLADRSIGGDHATGIASIQRAVSTLSGLRYETPRSDRPYTALYPIVPGGEVPDDPAR